MDTVLLKSFFKQDIVNLQTFGLWGTSLLSNPNRRVITYTLLCGYSPFRSENRDELIEETIRARVVFHERYWKDISQSAKDFILALLQADPAKRPTAKVISVGRQS
jgi:serine/threonine protein kinase